jgi:hypothetical protein
VSVSWSRGVLQEGHYLKHNLWDGNRVRGRAFSSDTCTRKRGWTFNRVRNVRLVVGRVEVDAVPASVQLLVVGLPRSTIAPTLDIGCWI